MTGFVFKNWICLLRIMHKGKTIIGYRFYIHFLTLRHDNISDIITGMLMTKTITWHNLRFFPSYVSLFYCIRMLVYPMSFVKDKLLKYLVIYKTDKGLTTLNHVTSVICTFTTPIYIYI